MESDILTARIFDTADICDRNNIPKYLGFLSIEESVLAEHLLSKRNISFSLYGGFSDATRKMLGCFPEWMSEYTFPITPLTFIFREEDTLSHRDFLGSLMGLGIKRETVGDILVEKGRAVVFVIDEIADYILNEIKKIGRTGVKISKGYNGNLPKGDSLQDFSVTISSQRIDCVVSALGSFSRNTACEKIAFGLVSINSVVCEKTTKTVSQGDVVTIRGKGKFIIDSISDKTRKDRIVLRYKKYV